METRGTYLKKLFQSKTCKKQRLPSFLTANVVFDRSSNHVPLIKGVQHLKLVNNDHSFSELTFYVVKATPSFRKVFQEKEVKLKKEGSTCKMGDYIVK